MSRKYFKKPKNSFGIPAYFQLKKIREVFPNAIVRKKKFDHLDIEMSVRPTAISKLYQLKIIYSKNKKVDVFVIGEKLAVSDNRSKLPHVYSTTEQKLCLYTPSKREWSPNMLIVQSIIPWAIEWLDFYEHWLIDGEWQGGGHNEYEAEKNS